MQRDTGQGDTRVHADLAHLQGMQRFARQISFLPRQPASSVLNGQHASKLRGRGLNFEEMRHYQKGDDVRTIDWKATARTREPQVRVYTEERDRPVLLLVDQRMSMFFGSTLNMKSVTAAEAAALAAWRIRFQGDRVGGAIFSDDRIAELTPKASGLALNRFLSVLANANNRLNPNMRPKSSVALNQVLLAAARIAKTGMMILVFSDFHDLDEQSEALLRRLSAHNDVLLFPISDPAGSALPDNFRVVASDGERQVTIAATSRSMREGIQRIAMARAETLLELERKYGIVSIPLSTGENTEQQVLRLLSGEGRR